MHAVDATPSRARFGTLMLGAIGVVFGDIGTSPLYTIKEAFTPHYGLSPDMPTVLGVLSLVLWTLIIVITVKYVAVIMDNVVAGADGTVAVNIHLAGVTLGGGAANDIADRAIVVHGNADDYTSQPAGNSGPRVACGVIKIMP